MEERKIGVAGGAKEKAATVIIRTPSQIAHSFDVRLHERVDKVARMATDYFVDQQQLEKGDYGLALVRDGQAILMTDSGRLEDYGVVENDVLNLIPKEPQADGE